MLVDVERLGVDPVQWHQVRLLVRHGVRLLDQVLDLLLLLWLVLILMKYALSLLQNDSLLWDTDHNLRFLALMIRRQTCLRVQDWQPVRATLACGAAAHLDQPVGALGR